MKQTYTTVLAILAFIASVFNQYSDLFADYPNFHKFLPVFTSVLIGSVAIIQARFNPDGTPAVTQYTGAVFENGGRKLMGVLLACLLIPTLSAASCSETTIYKKAAQANYSIFVGVAATQEFVETLNKGDANNGVGQQLSDEKYLEILLVEREIIINNQEFRKLLAASATLDPGKAAELIKLADNMQTGVGRLNNLGLLHIKDPKKQVAFAAILTTLQLALQSADTLLGQIKAPVTLPQPITLSISVGGTR